MINKNINLKKHSNKKRNPMFILEEIKKEMITHGLNNIKFDDDNFISKSKMIYPIVAFSGLSLFSVIGAVAALPLNNAVSLIPYVISLIGVNAASLLFFKKRDDEYWKDLSRFDKKNKHRESVIADLGRKINEDNEIIDGAFVKNAAEEDVFQKIILQKVDDKMFESTMIRINEYLENYEILNILSNYKMRNLYEYGLKNTVYYLISYITLAKKTIINKINMNKNTKVQHEFIKRLRSDHKISEKDLFNILSEETKFNDEGSEIVGKENMENAYSKINSLLTDEQIDQVLSNNLLYEDLNNGVFKISSPYFISKYAEIADEIVFNRKPYDDDLEKDILKMKNTVKENEVVHHY